MSCRSRPVRARSMAPALASRSPRAVTSPSTFTHDDEGDRIVEELQHADGSFFPVPGHPAGRLLASIVSVRRTMRIHPTEALSEDRWERWRTGLGSTTWWLWSVS